MCLLINFFSALFDSESRVRAADLKVYRSGRKREREIEGERELQRHKQTSKYKGIKHAREGRNGSARSGYRMNSIRRPRAFI